MSQKTENKKYLSKKQLSLVCEKMASPPRCQRFARSLGKCFPPVIEYQDIVMNWSDYFITLMCIYREIGKSYSAGIQ